MIKWDAEMGADKTWTYSIHIHEFTIPRYFLDGQKQLMLLSCWCGTYDEDVFIIPPSRWRARLLSDMCHANT